MAVRGIESSLNDPKYISAVEKQIAEILNRQDAVESKVDAVSRAPRTVNDTPDVDISGTALPDGGVNPTRRFTPSAPAGLNAATAISFNDGSPFVSISIGYERVTNALAGDPITIARHELQGRKVGGEWKTLTSSDGGAVIVNFSPLPTGESWEFRMRAVSAQGISGPYSEALLVSLPDDTTPPPIPSKPILSTRLGTVSVAWDGKAVGGTGMPSDFHHVEVQQSSNNAEFAVVGSIRTAGIGSAYVVTGLPYNNGFYFRLVAVDNSGNRSAGSASSYIVVTPLVDTDVIGQIINGANIVQGSINAADKIIGNTITGDLIQALTIKAGNIDSNAITTDKILAGSIIGVKIAANTITTNNLVIGDFTNLAPPPRSPEWNGLGAWSEPTWAASSGYALWMAGNQGSGNNDRTGPTYDTFPGERFSISGYATYSGTQATNGVLMVGAQWFNAAGGNLGWTTNAVASSAVSAYNFTVTVAAPANAAKVAFWVGRNAPTSSGSGTSYVAMWDYSMRRMTTGALLVDGAIDGKTITGAIVRTAASGARVQLDSTGLHAFNAAGTEVTTISAATGQVTALGSFATGTSGQRVNVTGIGIDFYSQNEGRGRFYLNAVGAPSYMQNLVIAPSQGDAQGSSVIVQGSLYVQRTNSTSSQVAVPITLTGTATFSVPAGSGQTTTVTFPAGTFSNTPDVLVSFGPSASYYGGLHPSVWSVSATSLVIGVSNPGATARGVTVTWMAVL